jgi:hypothetical protein
MSLDFTAIDFDRASSQPGSVCSVGLVRIRDGQIVHESGGLVRPPQGLGDFDDYHTSVHGITADMVTSAPPAQAGREPGHRPRPPALRASGRLHRHAEVQDQGKGQDIEVMSEDDFIRTL